MLNNIAALLDSGVTAALTDYESIATVTVGAGGSSTVTFSSISGSYSHLQIRGMFLSNAAEENMRMRFNSDSGSNYARHYLGGNGASAFAAATANESYAIVGLSPNSTQPGSCVIDVLDYSKTTKYKTSRSLYGDDKNGAGYMFLCSGLWQNTAAVTSIELSFTGSATFSQYSKLALYGIK